MVCWVSAKWSLPAWIRDLYSCVTGPNCRKLFRWFIKPERRVDRRGNRLARRFGTARSFSFGTLFGVCRPNYTLWILAAHLFPRGPAACTLPTSDLRGLEMPKPHFSWTNENGDPTLNLPTWRIMGLSKYGYKYPKWGYK